LDALVHWRTTTLRKRASEGFLQPPTTQRHQQREPVADHIRSQSEPPSVAEMRKMEGEDKTEAMTAAGGRKGSDAVSLGTNSTGATKKPTSSSWVQWWGRGRKKNLQDTQAKDTTKNVEKVNGVLDIVRIHIP
jgi:phosphatidate phosphatase LPIN